MLKCPHIHIFVHIRDYELVVISNESKESVKVLAVEEAIGVGGRRIQYDWIELTCGGDTMLPIRKQAFSRPKVHNNRYKIKFYPNLGINEKKH